jgi:cobalt/nickel transport system permease protein
MDKLTRNLAIGLVLLIIIAPIGLIASGTAYGDGHQMSLKIGLGMCHMGWKSSLTYGMHQ